MSIFEIVGRNPRIEQPSRNYKKSFKRCRTREERLADFISSEDFQLFCQAEQLPENSVVQFCFNSDEEIRILFGGKVIWMDGMSYRVGLESLTDVKAPKFITRLTARQQAIFFTATYWLSRNEAGVWQAELLLGDDAFLQAKVCEDAFQRVAQLFGGKVSTSFLATGKIKEKESIYRFANLSLPGGEQKLLAVSFDNGALVLLDPEMVSVIPNQKGACEVYRTTYNWFRSLNDGNFRRIL